MMRTKTQLKNGDPLYKIVQKFLFAELPSFSGVSFFGLDEMHLIAHGIGKHVYELIIANIKGSSNIFYTDENKRQKKDSYTFHFTAEEIKKMGEALEQSRSTIPTSFQGSWDNIFAKIDGTRAVDWLDFLLHVVPIVVAPFHQGCFSSLIRSFI
ncbi:hypothetical protein G6F56_013422 [Rhizopus delemar]|nr:hypothetical protein G6F56_013422 [Rhizopus delemar]